MNDTEAIGAEVLDRIRTLWGYRAWYAAHTGWIVQERVDQTRELRYLIALVRKARRNVPRDPVTEAKAYHDWQSEAHLYDEPNIEGMPEFNRAFA